MTVEIGQSGIWDALDAVQCAKIPRGIVLNRYWYGDFYDGRFYPYHIKIIPGVHNPFR
jgi:hypothetical protein